MTVNQIKNIVTSLVSAEKKGFKLRAEQFNLYLKKANHDLFNQAIKKWEKGQAITDMLYPFKVKTDLTFAAGVATRPANYARFSAAYYGTEEYDDWFLPSRNELDAMRVNLHDEGVGDFNVIDYYWSSSEYSNTQAYSQRMDDTTGLDNKGGGNRVRACRLFAGLLGDYSLRDTGPAGGLIFYFTGAVYYEAAPSDQSASQIWSNIEDVLIGTTSTAIGEGQNNTNEIIAQAGGADDWFLPSKDEFDAMYTNLHVAGVGGFAGDWYWSSFEHSEAGAWYIDFATGFPNAADKINGLLRIRGCRSFVAGAGDYALRDTGPAGGLIFYVDGTTFYEAAPSDQSINYLWADTKEVIGTTSAIIGEGQDNTNKIVAMGYVSSAAKLCDDYDNSYAHTDSAAELCDDLAIGGTSGSTVPVELVTDAELPDRINNAITAPTTNYPIICFYDQKINIFPDTITNGVDLLYIKKPIEPVYVEKVDEGINVYDSVNSVQLEWGEVYHPDIIRLIVGFTGIKIKDSIVIQAIHRERQRNVRQ